MEIDVRTMFLMIIVTSVVMGVAVLVVAWGKEVEGLHYWAAGLLLSALGFLLLGLRGLVPDLISVLLGNVLLTASPAVMLAAMYRFQGRPTLQVSTVAPTLLSVLVLVATTNDISQRVIGLSLLIGWQTALLAKAPLERWKEGTGRGRYLIVLGAGLAAAVTFVRALFEAMGWVVTTSITRPSPMHIATFICAFCAVVLISIGFIFGIKERAEARTRDLAMRDALTGISNRRAVLDSLEHALAHSVRAHLPLALLMLDIDHFKKVNDTHGHLAGDGVLTAVARVVSKRIRTQDIVGRYGGEEFLVILPGTPAAGAAHLAEQLRVAIKDFSTSFGQTDIRVTISIGVTAKIPDAATTADTMVHAADQALYLAKARGRDRVEAST